MPFEAWDAFPLKGNFISALGCFIWNDCILDVIVCNFVSQQVTRANSMRQKRPRNIAPFH